MTSTAKACTS